MLKIGKEYPSNNYGYVKILSESVHYGYYNVQFKNTGTIKSFREDQIKSGCIRDPYAKSVCGVGYTGDVKTKGKNKTYYSIWHDMINRCYNTNDKQFNTYKNVTVDDTWLSFENFLNDVKYVDGFDDEKIKNGELVLGKDVKQRFLQNKVYSKNTCTWISKEQNQDIQDAQQREFCAISPEGEIYFDYNITRFAREHGLSRRHISGVLHNRAKSTNGWKFSYKDIV